MTVIDAHVHLWDLAARPQPWTEQFPPLRRSFLLADLENVLHDHGVDAAVVVQAGDTTGETRDLLALAAGNPPIASGDLEAWRADLARLAALPNVAVKLSGLVTKADWAAWAQSDLAPAIDHVLACFGADRAMMGSDWPVSLLAASYAAVRATLDPVLARLDDDARDAVLGGTAAGWYRTGA